MEINITQGEALNIEVQDSEAVSVTLFVSVDTTTPAVIIKSATFTTGVAIIELLNVDTDIAVADYIYQIRLYDTDGQYFNLETADCDDDDCTEAVFSVCPSLVVS